MGLRNSIKNFFESQPLEEVRKEKQAKDLDKMLLQRKKIRHERAERVKVLIDEAKKQITIDDINRFMYYNNKLSKNLRNVIDLEREMVFQKEMKDIIDSGEAFRAVKDCYGARRIIDTLDEAVLNSIVLEEDKERFVKMNNLLRDIYIPLAW